MREYEHNGELKTSWTTCGVAFKSDKGFNLILDTLPVNGKLFVNTQDVVEKQPIEPKREYKR